MQLRAKIARTPAKIPGIIEQVLDHVVFQSAGTRRMPKLKVDQQILSLACRQLHKQEARSLLTHTWMRGQAKSTLQTDGIDGIMRSPSELGVDWIHPWIGLDWVKSLMYQNVYSHFCSPNHLPVEQEWWIIDACGFSVGL